MSEELYSKIADEFAVKHGSVSGQMFGKPCLKVNKKTYAAFYQNEMVFKLGQQEVNLLKEKYIGSVNWDPSGKSRAMKDWLQVPCEYKEDWIEFAKKALEFVEKNSKD